MVIGLEGCGGAWKHLYTDASAILSELISLAKSSGWYFSWDKLTAESAEGVFVFTRRAHTSGKKEGRKRWRTGGGMGGTRYVWQCMLMLQYRPLSDTTLLQHCFLGGEQKQGDARRSEEEGSHEKKEKKANQGKDPGWAGQIGMKIYERYLATTNMRHHARYVMEWRIKTKTKVKQANKNKE